jgi:prevent-host-death family protein
VDPNVEQILISKLSEASSTERSVTLSQSGKPLAVVLSVSDYQKFQAEQEERLQKLKVKLKGILSLVRAHIQHRSLEEVEAQLASLRQTIEQELNKID